MAIEIKTHWSHKLQKRVHRIGVEGTAHSFLANDDDLVDLIRLAQGVLNHDDKRRDS